MSGVVAAGDPQTARAAAEVLGAGGNAVDAAVAGAFASFVAEPLLSSAGGAGLLLCALPGRAPSVVDFFSAAPALSAQAPPHPDFEAVEIDFGGARQTFHVGRGAAAAPLALAGLVRAARTFGALPLARLVAPAVRLGREGAIVSPQAAHVFRLLFPIYRRDAATCALLAPRGEPARPGDVLHHCATADLLEELGREGRTPARFFRGLLEAFGPGAGGLLSAADLDEDHARVRAPLSVPLGAHEVLLPPGAGGRLVAGVVAHLASSEAGGVEPLQVARLALASREAHLRRVALAAPGSTTHLSVLDGSGGAASVTLTNGEGSGHLVPGTGVQVNNFLGEEDLNPLGFHRHGPGAKLPTMVAPTLVLRDRVPVLALGSGGSNRIRSAVSQVLHRVTTAGEPLADAVLAPRVHAETDDAFLELEGLTDPEGCVRALGERFARVHPFAHRDFFFGGVHAVRRRADGALEGVGDPRRGGAVCRA